MGVRRCRSFLGFDVKCWYCNGVDCCLLFVLLLVEET